MAAKEEDLLILNMRAVVESVDTEISSYKGVERKCCYDQMKRGIFIVISL